jgi:V8-like Glu-specific endopeptidase
VVEAHRFAGTSVERGIEMAEHRNDDAEAEMEATIRTDKDMPLSNGDLLVEEVESLDVSTGEADGAGAAGGVHAGADEGLEAVGFHLPPAAEAAGLEAAERAAPVEPGLRDIGEASFGPPSPIITRDRVAETVQGIDDRVQIADTHRYPWRAHASLRIVAADGSLWIGTGWFISPRVLVTAGHVVHIKNSGVPGRDGWVREIRVMPGRNGASLPYGSSTSVRFYTVRGWADNGDEEYDYGAIVLADRLGARTGWFGFGAYTDSVLSSVTANISGYPGDKPAGTQWYHGRRVDSTSNRKVFYDTDTAGGQSGSAVYRIRDGKRYAFAVHAYGGTRVNSGTRITRPVFDNLKAWKAAHP